MYRRPDNVQEGKNISRGCGIKEDLKKKGLRPESPRGLVEKFLFRIKEDLKKKGLRPIWHTTSRNVRRIKEDLKKKGLRHAPIWELFLYGASRIKEDLKKKGLRQIDSDPHMGSICGIKEDLKKKGLRP